MITTVLFDLDGTLLPMDHNKFIKEYFKQLLTIFIPLGFEATKLSQAINIGMEAMIENNGSSTNEDVFWDKFSNMYGKNMRGYEPEFLKFYQNDFKNVIISTTPTPYASSSVDKLKQKGYEIVIASNPVFPKVATLERMRWAGLKNEDFSFVTTYENSSYCKPNLNYYLGILDAIKKTPEECIMIGNDVSEDMCCSELLIDTYLIMDCLINKKNLPLTHLKHGNFSDFEKYIDTWANLQ